MIKTRSNRRDYGWINPTACMPLMLLATFLLPGPWTPSARADGDPPEFHAFLDPELICDVFVGDPVAISFDVDATAVQFNGYELSLHWGPTILDFATVTPGVLMTQACPIVFENVSQTDSTLTYAHVILCANVSVNGPGRLSTFHFDTIAPGITEVRITSDPDLTFLDAGLWVRPSHSSFPRQVVFLRNGKSTVVVNDPSADVDPSMDDSSFYLRVLPNPARDDFRIELRDSSPGPIEGQVFDAAGRVRFSWHEPDAPAMYGLRLDLTDTNGRFLPGGTYFVRTQRGGEVPRVERLIVVR